MTKKTWQKLAGIAAALTLIGCGSNPSAAPQTQPAQTGPETTLSTNLEEALAFVPEQVDFVSFTNWEYFKQQLGADDITGENERSEKFDFYGQVINTQAFRTWYEQRYLSAHAENWLWESVDLRWEMLFEKGNLGHTYVFRFRDDYDFEPLRELFLERGYSPDYRADSVIYSTSDLRVGDKWPAEALTIRNVALLEDQHTMVMAVSLDFLYQVLDTSSGDAPAVITTPAVETIAGILGETGFATIDLPERCVWSADWSPAVPGDLHRYEAFGLGYHYEGETPTGFIVMVYDDDATAEADRQVRQDLIDAGSASGTLGFTVQTGYTQANSLVYEVNFVNDDPEYLTDILLYASRGLLEFASC